MVEEKSAPMEKQLCGFKIGQDYYAIPVLDVQEVIRPHRVTPIPLAGDEIRGLINLRGQIVTAISLRKIFGLQDDLAADHMNIIVSAGESLYSLVVDEILDVIDVEGHLFEGTPDILDDKIKSYIKGVYKLDKKLLILIDLEKIVNIQT